MPRPDAIMLAAGHYAKRSGVCKKRAVLDNPSMDRVLGMMEDIAASTGALNRPLGVEFFESAGALDEYERAAARKDRRMVDSTVFAALAAGPIACRRLIEAEEWSLAFNEWLRKYASTAPFAYRWMDPEELEGLKSGTFQNKAENGIKRRNHKALSLNPRLKFMGRKIMATVPLTASVLGSVRHVQYTALPRAITEEDEEIGDPKSVRHANEAEIRVPDGAAIPSGTSITVRRGAGTAKGALDGLEKLRIITT